MAPRGVQQSTDYWNANCFERLPPWQAVPNLAARGFSWEGAGHVRGMVEIGRWRCNDPGGMRQRLLRFGVHGALRRGENHLRLSVREPVQDPELQSGRA